MTNNNGLMWQTTTMKTKKKTPTVQSQESATKPGPANSKSTTAASFPWIRIWAVSCWWGVPQQAQKIQKDTGWDGLILINPNQLWHLGKNELCHALVVLCHLGIQEQVGGLEIPVEPQGKRWPSCRSIVLPWNGWSDETSMDSNWFEQTQININWPHDFEFFFFFF